MAAPVPQQLVLVMTNKSVSYSYQTIQTSAHWAADPDRRLWKVYKTADDGSATQRLTLTENFSGAELTGNRNLVLAPYSITTILINSDAPISNLENWRQQYFGTYSNLDTASNTSDADKDGESNLYEFDTAQNPQAATLVTPSVALSGGNVHFTYTRGKAALLDGVTFTVETSETLAPGSWVAATTAGTVVGETGTTQTVRLTLPAGSSRSFLRLRIQP